MIAALDETGPRTTGQTVPAPACQHRPPCPPANAPDCYRAHTLVSHPEQGWSLLCNRIIAFDDLGALLPNRTTFKA
ncbi:MAG TPA: DUF5999 family protein [Actinocrinis sp.]|nr:DUF5999 family protein [Actinocrinis sp.]